MLGEHFGNLFERLSGLFGNVVVQGGINVTASCPHHHTFLRCETHGGVHAAAASDGAGTAPIAEMNGNQLKLIERLVQCCRSSCRHELMAGSMEAVASNLMPVVIVSW